MKRGLTLVLFLMIRFFTTAQQPAATIPDFNFFKFNESSFTNKDLAQDRLLFFVFFDVTCEHCQHAIKEMNEHYKEYTKSAIYLVTVDVKARVNPFLDTYAPNLKNNKNVTLLQDLKNEFILKFKPRKYPSMFLYSKEKKLMLYDDNEQNLSTFLQKIKT